MPSEVHPVEFSLLRVALEALAYMGLIVALIMLSAAAAPPTRTTGTSAIAAPDMTRRSTPVRAPRLASREMPGRGSGVGHSHHGQRKGFEVTAARVRTKAPYVRRPPYGSSRSLCPKAARSSGEHPALAICLNGLAGASSQFWVLQRS